MVANNGISKAIASQIPELTALVDAMQTIENVSRATKSWRMWAESFVCLAGYRGVLGIRMSSNCCLRSACIPLLFIGIPFVPACGRVVSGIGRAELPARDRTLTWYSCAVSPLSVLERVWHAEIT